MYDSSIFKSDWISIFFILSEYLTCLFKFIILIALNYSLFYPLYIFDFKFFLEVFIYNFWQIVIKSNISLLANGSSVLSSVQIAVARRVIIFNVINRHYLRVFQLVYSFDRVHLVIWVVQRLKFFSINRGVDFKMIRILRHIRSFRNILCISSWNCLLSGQMRLWVVSLINILFLVNLSITPF